MSFVIEYNKLVKLKRRMKVYGDVAGPKDGSGLGVGDELE